MLNNIISVESINKNFKLTWNIEKACNYNCSYCFPGRHSYISDSNYKLKSLQDLQIYWNIIYNAIDNRTIDIAFSGGEPSLNKNLIDFISYIKEFQNIGTIGVSSNGSASPAYYIKLLTYINSLTLSIHSEFFNEKKFLNVARTCSKYSKNKQFQVVIMNEPFNDKINYYKTFFENHNINYTLQNIKHISQIEYNE